MNWWCRWFGHDFKWIYSFRPHYGCPNCGQELGEQNPPNWLGRNWSVIVPITLAIVSIYLTVKVIFQNR